MSAYYKVHSAKEMIPLYYALLVIIFLKAKVLTPAGVA